jgi:hypothetical protein
MTPTKLRALEIIGIGLMVLAVYLTAILVIMLISMARGNTVTTLAITAIGAATAGAVSLSLRRYTRRLRNTT